MKTVASTPPPGIKSAIGDSPFNYLKVFKNDNGLKPKLFSSMITKTTKW